MSNAAAIIILCVTVVESVAIFIGNILTIFVFWKHRNKLKRTSFLLVNLAIADLLVGVSQLALVGTYAIPQQQIQANDIGNGNISTAFQTTFSSSSIFFLVFISLERAYALIWPLRHRVTSTKVYIYGVMFVWIAGISVGALSLLATYGVLNFVQWRVAFNFIIVLALVTICVAYLTVRTKLNCNVPAMDNVHNRQNVPEQNAKLSRTLFIVIAASFFCWCPSTMCYYIHYLCSECVPLSLLLIFNIFHLANSLVNPIIYSVRMPMFRETFKRMKCRKQSKQYIVNYIS